MWIYKELEKRLCRCLYILFLTATSFADFCIFSVPPPSLGIVSVPRNWRNICWLSATYICRFYILRRKVDSAWESRFCVGEVRCIMVEKNFRLYSKTIEYSNYYRNLSPSSQYLWILTEIACRMYSERLYCYNLFIILNCYNETFLLQK